MNTFKRGDTVMRYGCGSSVVVSYRDGPYVYFIGGGCAHYTELEIITFTGCGLLDGKNAIEAMGFDGEGQTLGESALKPKFKSGDRVQLICHDQDHGTITEMFYDYFRAAWDNGEGNNIWFDISDIRPSTKPTLGKPPKFVSSQNIVVKKVGSNYRPSASPIVHGNTDDAETEARRLAVKHPGVEFAVFMLVSNSSAPEPCAVTVSV
jgi:hypothetical protein